jgi:hypothetical protein
MERGLVESDTGIDVTTIRIKNIIVVVACTFGVL